MASRFMKGIKCTPAELPPKKNFRCEEFLILILLFVLLAASPSLGLDSSYFFIIIMAVIALGGIDKAFGLTGRNIV
ncbi:MAG TPA: hypothetical protein PL076_07635 [Bacillota bacterium]|jgi:hypothetical protein|nr:hypothetical protein [Bacillota bacterium]HRS21412.1 hypothetical protein [Clostridia bacterium]HRU41235.1 hypothetical protein [Candidatus Diapherotrites archaeon]HQE65936.1 hypothetical protein [Bacillota bacterium]HQI15814.1 hypothetical protein [Bacillota bacterium]